MSQGPSGLSCACCPRCVWVSPSSGGFLPPGRPGRHGPPLTAPTAPARDRPLLPQSPRARSLPAPSPRESAWRGLGGGGGGPRLQHQVSLRERRDGSVASGFAGGRPGRHPLPGAGVRNEAWGALPRAGAGPGQTWGCPPAGALWRHVRGGRGLGATRNPQLLSPRSPRKQPKPWPRVVGAAERLVAEARGPERPTRPLPGGQPWTCTGSSAVSLPPVGRLGSSRGPLRLHRHSGVGLTASLLWLEHRGRRHLLFSQGFWLVAGSPALGLSALSLWASRGRCGPTETPCARTRSVHSRPAVPCAGPPAGSSPRDLPRGLSSLSQVPPSGRSGAEGPGAPAGA